jgi:sialate O-acetylesterase
LIPFAIRGAIWYQGESNGGEGVSYFHKKQALIGGWRQLWNQGDFPFYFVQLANFQKPTEDPAGGDGWARIRDAQKQCLGIPNTGMAVIIDIGQANDIHPRNKQDVGARLALWALAKEYGRKDVVCSGPLYKAHKVEGNSIRIEFDDTGGALMVGRKNGLEPTAEDPEAKLTWFAIAGEDRKWHWADAKIDGETVVVSCPDVPNPVAVRYAYAMNPQGCNLYNRAGLPAAPFRTDDW